MDKVKAYLKVKHKDYWEGVRLYEQHAPAASQALLRQLKKGETAYRKEKLIEALQTLPAKEKQANYNLTQRYAQPAKPRTDHQQLPEVLQKKDVEKAQLFKQANKLHYHLDQLQTDHKRKEAAAKIMDCFHHISQIWADIDYYHAHGQLPEHLKEKPADQGNRLKLSEFLKRYENIPSKLTRARKKLKQNITEQERDQLNDKIQKLEQERQRLNQIADDGFIVYE